MKQEIKLPKISDGADSGLVAEIYISEGDEVEAEQSVMAVESDKATVEVPVEESGIIDEIRVDEGEEISTGDVFMVLDTKSKEESNSNKEETQNSKEDKKEAKQEAENSQSQKDKPVSDKNNQENKPNKTTTETEEEDSSDVPAAPLAKKFARELGISIEDLQANDPEKRINRADVLAYAKEIITSKQNGHAGGQQQTRQLSEIKLPDFSKWGDVETAEMDGVRYATAETTVTSWQNIPHVTHFDKADITDLEAYRKTQDKQIDEKLTVTAMLLKVCASALKKYPKFNASIDIDKKEIIYKKYIHIGVAVDTPKGLLLPVIRDVNEKSIQDLSKELVEIGEKARNGKLSPDEMKGGNFVISNLGGIGGTNFTPVIFPPQAAILGVSRSNTEPVYNKENNSFEPRLMLPLSLSYDHRLIDGADAARFTKWLCDTLVQPLNLVM